MIEKFEIKAGLAQSISKILPPPPPIEPGLPVTLGLGGKKIGEVVGVEGDIVSMVITDPDARRALLMNSTFSIGQTDGHRLYRNQG